MINRYFEIVTFVILSTLLNLHTLNHHIYIYDKRVFGRLQDYLFQEKMLVKLDTGFSIRHFLKLTIILRSPKVPTVRMG